MMWLDGSELCNGFACVDPTKWPAISQIQRYCYVNMRGDQPGVDPLHYGLNHLGCRVGHSIPRQVWLLAF